MDAKKIRELWTSFIDQEFKYVDAERPISSTPYCATCTHWWLFDENPLATIQVYAPEKYKEICRGIEGDVSKLYIDGKASKQTYRDHRFYGFCKRYPPYDVETTSILKYRPLLSFTSIKMPHLLSRYSFPVTPHDEWCGEWKQAEWVKHVVEEKEKAKQKAGRL